MQAETIQLIQRDAWRMECLEAVESLDLPDWYITGRGFRSAGRPGPARDRGRGNAPSLAAERGLPVLEHRAHSFPGVGAGAGAAGDLVQVLVLEALAQ